MTTKGFGKAIPPITIMSALMEKAPIASSRSLRASVLGGSMTMLVGSGFVGGAEPALQPGDCP